ncbi:hypothetical protein E2562_013689 [Oryza meyeriana var. granulata]|uniref:Auxin efflux carrier component n=1 Tax=Oryza meyeriana var. granulata TaxID=110450 RepID=A0A6G1BKF7_9ORYZ|nr:hypothetical protein E2562_013689 [Oryza meyeriana var. granulata]
MIAVGRVAEDLLPPYAVLLLAFLLARCLGRGRLTPEHCNWANWLVGNIVNPFFILQLAVDGLDLGKLDYRVLAADAVSKALISILILAGIVVASWRGTLLGHATRLDWFVTFFSLSTLTSTLAVGVPLTSALYGRDAETVVRQLAVFQTLVWFPIILLLFHVRTVPMQAVPAHGVDPAFGGGGAAIGDVRLQVDHVMEGENVGDGDAVAGDADLTAQVDHVEADDGAVDAGVGELELRDGAAVVARVGNLRPPQVRRVHAGVGELELPVQVGHVDDVVEVVVVEAANDDDSAGGAASDVDLPVETANDGGVPPGLEEMQPAAAVAMSSLPFLFMKKLYACVKFAMDMSSNPNIIAAIFGVAWPFATNRLQFLNPLHHSCMRKNLACILKSLVRW